MEKTPEDKAVKFADDNYSRFRKDENLWDTLYTVYFEGQNESAATISRLTEVNSDLEETNAKLLAASLKLTEELEQAKKQSYEAGVMCQRRLDSEEITKLREALKEARMMVASGNVRQETILKFFDSLLNHQNKDA